MATQYDNAIQKLYIAYFNRPADAAGLAHYATVVAAAGGSTAAVSAEFAASKEYKDAYGNMTTRDVVITIYNNLFGHAPDDAGRDYYVDAIVNKGLSIDKAVTEIAGGAKTTDLEAYENKVAYAEAFTAALKTDAEKAGYSGDLANKAAKGIVATITTDASLAAAIDPAALSASVAAVIKAAVPFTLAGALQTLDAAQDARGDFLDAYAEANDLADAAAAEAAIGATKTAIIADIADPLKGGVVGYDVAVSDGLKAALLADKQTANADALKTAQATLKTANEAVAKVTGLTGAVASAASTATVLENAVKAETTAAAKLDGAVTTFEALNGPLTLGDLGTAEATIAGVVVPLIAFNSSGKLALLSGVTEAKYPGVTALLTASVALETAQTALANADVAATAAAVQVEIIDAPNTAALATLGGAFTIQTATATPTAAQVSVELTSLAAKFNTLQAAANIDATKQPDADAAKTALDTFKTAIGTYLTDDVTNTVSDAQVAGAAAVKAVQEQIADLAELVADLTTANADVAKLTALDKAITAATAVFGENKLATPVVLGDATHLAVAATSGNDVYLASDDATVFSFGDMGTDSLYIGKGYTLNTGALSTGSDTKLEVFFVADGDNTVVTIETKAFGSSSEGEAEVLITLTGVAPSELKLSADGIITLA